MSASMSEAMRVLCLWELTAFENECQFVFVNSLIVWEEWAKNQIIFMMCKYLLSQN